MAPAALLRRLRRLERAADPYGGDPPDPRDRLSALLKRAADHAPDVGRTEAARAFAARFGSAPAFAAELRAGTAFDGPPWVPAGTSPAACLAAQLGGPTP